MLTVQEFYKERIRMCLDMNGCLNCPMTKAKRQLKIEHLDCLKFCSCYPDVAVEVVETWEKQHHEKTNFEKFQEVFGVDLLYLVNNATEFYKWASGIYKEDVIDDIIEENAPLPINNDTATSQDEQFDMLLDKISQLRRKLG